VKGDRVQLQQVLLNLIMNAIDAMQAVKDQRREIVVRSQIEGTTGVRVSVEDYGVGFSPGVIEKMFDPFFTTKAQGIGMGLSISRSIIESHHGRLWATRRPSGGAIFSFTVPVGSG
jgi:signal transduction histidine kinase